MRASRAGIDGPAVEGWRNALRASAALRLHLDHRLAGVAEALAAAGVAWAPIKGWDLGARVYERPEERPVGDADLLVGAGWERAREALEAAGWLPLVRGRRIDRYLAEEGYAWQATDGGSALLELHFRLWGLVPAAMAPELLAAAEPDPSPGALGPPPGSAGRRLPLAGAWLIAAVHAWLNPPPRPLLGWWDLERIAVADPGIGTAAVDLAVRWGLELPAGLAAAQAAALWPGAAGGAHEGIAAELLGRLRAPERAVARKALRHGTDALGLAPLVLSRLLARRPSRAGWRSLPRQVWAHPGVVELETPAGWRWPARRAVHVLRAFGFFFGR